MFEAAKIDGATSFQTFKNVTIPLLSPSIFFVVIITAISSFQVFDLTTSDLKFLFPEYEFIVEQAMKLNLPFIYTAFRKECNEFIKNMD